MVKESSKKVENKIERSQLNFPSWRSIINVFMHNAKEVEGVRVNSFQNDFSIIFEKLNQAQEIVKDYHPIKMVNILENSNGVYIPQQSFMELQEKFELTSIGPNEFYSVYDMMKCYHSFVDPKVNTILGIRPEDFSIQAMIGMDPENDLYHIRDNNHVIRWASLGYMLITFPFFTWRSLQDYYQVSFRVGTKKSSVSNYRKNKHVLLEKKCFPYYESDENGNVRPCYHFDKWSVFGTTGFEFVRPVWVGSPVTSPIINSLHFLLNAYLLDLPVKYLLILNERQNHDRNKAIANSMNSKMAEYAGINTNFDEFQIGDYFAKTIRERIAKIMNLWDKRQPDDLVTVDSDHLAVYYAKTLGLLPLPDNMEEMIYGQITW